MSAVDGILLSDSEDEPFKNSYQDRDADDSNPFAMCCLCCCCCLCVFGPFVFNIMVAINSIGYTSCPELAPILGSNTTDIPAVHTVVTKAWQGWDLNFFYKEANVYDPSVSNQTRMGYWRTTKTWYLRDAWAFVPEGSEKPGVVVHQPFFTWTTSFTIERCFPATKHFVSQNWGWFWQWGETHQEWSIHNGADQSIAVAKKSKDWKWTPFGMPNGWQTIVWSTLTPNLVLGQLSQSHSSWYRAASDSAWAVFAEKPDQLDPHVFSFLAAASDLATRRRRSDHHRRLKGRRDTEEMEEELEEDEEVV